MSSKVKIRHINRIAKPNSTVNININKGILKENDMIKNHCEIPAKQQQKQSKFHAPTEFLKMPLTLILNLAGLLLAFLTFVMVYSIYLLFATKFNVLYFVYYIIFLIISALFSFVCFKVSKDIDKETDKLYIANYFAAMVSFVALIVSLVSLVVNKK